MSEGVKRWLAALMAALCFAGALVFLRWAYGAYLEFRADPEINAAVLYYLLGLAPGGGILDMNADDYVEAKGGMISSAAWFAGIAAALARLGWLRLRRFRRGAAQDEAGAPPRLIVTVLRTAAITLLMVAGLFTGWMSLQFCAPWYWWLFPQDRFFRSDASFVGELGAMSLLALLAVLWLLRRRSRWRIPLVLLALLVFWQAWESGTGVECLSLPRMLHGGQWVLQVDS